MIEAVIFDCFGVLATDGWLPFRERFFADNDELLEAVTTSNKQVDAGLKDYDDFLVEVAQLAGISEGEARRLIERNVPNDALFTFIERELAPHYKLGILSNAGRNWLRDIFSPAQLSLFDGTLLSYEIGATKPDARMYESIAARLDVVPESCLFIDDILWYCEAATRIGMQSIHFENTNQVVQGIRAILHA